MKNGDYWKQKRRRNAARDRQNINELKRLGWKVLTVWECEIKDLEALEQRIAGFLVPHTHAEE